MVKKGSKKIWGKTHRNLLGKIISHLAGIEELWGVFSIITQARVQYNYIYLKNDSYQDILDYKNAYRINQLDHFSKWQ